MLIQKIKDAIKTGLVYAALALFCTIVLTIIVGIWYLDHMRF